MVALAGATVSTQKKMKTYGKPSRKRQLHHVLPVRVSDPYEFPSDDQPTSQDTNAQRLMISKPSPIRQPAKKEPAKIDSNDQCESGPARSLKPGIDGQENNDSRKRKRPLPSNRATVKDNLARSLSTSSVNSASILKPVSGPSQSPSSTRKHAEPPPISRSTSMFEKANNSSIKGAPAAVQRSISQTGTFTKPVPKIRRPRLIDALTAQRPESPGSESSDDDEKLVAPFSSGTVTPSQLNQASQDSQPRLRTRPGAKAQGKRARLTYGQSRSILSESQTSSNTGMGSQEDELDALLATPPSLANPDPFSFGDDDVDEDGDLRPAIKSVHELKRAGANNRFADEMEDLLARIATPGNSHVLSRRNGLLELAQKLQRKDFMRQFRDHATRDKVAKGIGQEEDVVSGFALVAVLVMFLNFNPAPHFLRELVDDGLWKLLSHLLHVSEDIDQVALQSRPKLSKASRIALEQVKATLMRMQIWHGHALGELSPQLLALQLLHLLCQQLDPIHSAGVVRDLEGELITVMDRYSNGEGEIDVTFPLVVSILETQSSLTMDPQDETSWISKHSSKVAHFLGRSLQKWPHQVDDLESTVLKLAINTTNTAQGAGFFNDEELLSSLSRCICTGFQSTQDDIMNQRLRGDTYDGLLLILGVMINILEHCQAARRSVDDGSVQRLITLYLDNQKSMNEADSVEKSQLSVAFGYLAVVLGYLSLVAKVRRRLAEQSHGEGISILIESIQEFIRMYKSVDSKVHELEGLVRELRFSTR